MQKFSDNPFGLDIRSVISVNSNTSQKLRKVSLIPTKDIMLFNSKISSKTSNNDVLGSIYARKQSQTLVQAEQKHQRQRKDLVMRKLYDSHRQLNTNLQKAVFERDSAARTLRDLESTNKKLTENYGKIIQLLQKIPAEEFSQKISHPPDKIHPSKLKTVTSHNLSESSCHDETSYIQQQQYELQLNKFNRVRAASIQTQYETSEHESVDNLPLQENKQFSTSSSIELVQKLERQNQELKLKLKRSQDLRNSQINNLRSIFNKTISSKTNL